jgi:hypothetical protein
MFSGLRGDHLGLESISFLSALIAADLCYRGKDVEFTVGLSKRVERLTCGYRLVCQYEGAPWKTTRGHRKWLAGKHESAVVECAAIEAEPVKTENSLIKCHVVDLNQRRVVLRC